MSWSAAERGLELLGQKKIAFEGKTAEGEKPVQPREKLAINIYIIYMLIFWRDYISGEEGQMEL